MFQLIRNAGGSISLLDLGKHLKVGSGPLWGFSLKKYIKANSKNFMLRGDNTVVLSVNVVEKAVTDVEKHISDLKGKIAQKQEEQIKEKIKALKSRLLQSRKPSSSTE